MNNMPHIAVVALSIALLLTVFFIVIIVVWWRKNRPVDWWEVIKMLMKDVYRLVYDEEWK